MADCELCGATTNLVKVSIEGSLMNVCPSCAKYGARIKNTKGKSFANNNNMFSKRNSGSDEEEYIVQNYGLIIKKAREQKNIKPELFAKQINEKESILLKIESGNYEPSFTLAKKIEKFLGVKLIKKRSVSKVKEEFEKQFKDNTNEKTQGLTFGDILQEAMKK